MGLETAAAEALGREFIAAIETRDWERLAACFAPDVVFRAVVPSEVPFREHGGPEAAARQIARWFSDADVHRLVDSQVDVLADRLHIRYRIHGREDGEWFLVEQQAFATLGLIGIRYLNLVCSGFRPAPPPSD